MLQLPRQDLSLNYTKYIARDQQPLFKDFCDARNDVALDIGYVKDKIPVTVVSNTTLNAAP